MAKARSFILAAGALGLGFAEINDSDQDSHRSAREAHFSVGCRPPSNCCGHSAQSGRDRGRGHRALQARAPEIAAMPDAALTIHVLSWQD